jgi:long-subunit acyl-CoA synthetase (AMP-forming)
LLTSGTTGASKGAVLTHNNFIANAVNIVTCSQITAADRLLLTLPLFHVHGLGNGVHAWLLSGCRMRLTERFAHEQAAGWMREFAPTLFAGSDDVCPHAGVACGGRGGDRRADAAVCFRVGTAASARARKFRGLYGHTILERYGMSENAHEHFKPAVRGALAGAVGLPLPGWRCERAAGWYDGGRWRGGELFLRARMCSAATGGSRSCSRPEIGSGRGILRSARPMATTRCRQARVIRLSRAGSMLPRR